MLVNKHFQKWPLSTDFWKLYISEILEVQTEVNDLREGFSLLQSALTVSFAGR